MGYKKIFKPHTEIKSDTNIRFLIIYELQKAFIICAHKNQVKYYDFSIHYISLHEFAYVFVFVFNKM